MSDDAAATDKKVLIVEDETILGDVYLRRLETEGGFEARKAGDGEEALRVAKEFKPDIILLDLMLPKVNGLTVLGTIRKDPELKDVKIIVFSALGQESDGQRAQELGANDYLIKSKASLTDVMDRIKFFLQ